MPEGSSVKGGSKRGTSVASKGTISKSMKIKIKVILIFKLLFYLD